MAKKVITRVEPAKYLVELPPDLVQVVNKGKSAGFVTTQEIEQVMPEAEKKIHLVDHLFDVLFAEGVELREPKRIIDLPGDAEKKEAIESLAEEVADDSVRMYLREIGRIQLLTGADEVRLAKRIEQGDEWAKKRLAEANGLPLAEVYRIVQAEGEARLLAARE